MSKEHDANEKASVESRRTVNRRSFVKTIGVAGGATVFGSAGASAASAEETTVTQEKASPEQINNTLQAEGVQTLLDKFGKATVQRGKAKNLSVDDDKNTEIITLPTQIGDIAYREDDNGTQTATLYLGVNISTEGDGITTEKIPPGLKKKFPQKYRHTPTDTLSAVGITDDGDEIAFRAATSGEQDRLAQRIGLSDNESITVAFVASETPAEFAVSTDSGNEYTAKLSTDQAPYREVVDEIPDATIDKSPSFTILVSDCFQYRQSCLQSTGITAACLAGCYGTGVLTSGLGFVLCAACSGAGGAAAGGACGKYVKNNCLG